MYKQNFIICFILIALSSFISTMVGTDFSGKWLKSGYTTFTGTVCLMSLFAIYLLIKPRDDKSKDLNKK